MKYFSKMLISSKDEIKNVDKNNKCNRRNKKMSKKKLATCYLRLHYFRR